MLWDLNKNLSDRTNVPELISNVFEKMLLVAHYYATRCALQLSKHDAKEVIFTLHLFIIEFILS